MTEDNIMLKLKRKFTSTNSVPVSRSSITRGEYEELCSFVLDLIYHADKDLQPCEGYSYSLKGDNSEEHF